MHFQNCVGVSVLTDGVYLAAVHVSAHDSAQGRDAADYIWYNREKWKWKHGNRNMKSTAHDHKCPHVQQILPLMLP